VDGLIVTTVGKGRFTTSLNGAQVLRNGIIVNWESANSHMTISRTYRDLDCPATFGRMICFRAEEHTQ